jgi:hypothetical protein
MRCANCKGTIKAMQRANNGFMSEDDPTMQIPQPARSDPGTVRRYRQNETDDPSGGPLPKIQRANNGFMSEDDQTTQFPQPAGSAPRTVRKYRPKELVIPIVKPWIPNEFMSTAPPEILYQQSPENLKKLQGLISRKLFREFLVYVAKTEKELLAFQENPTPTEERRLIDKLYTAQTWMTGILGDTEH